MTIGEKIKKTRTDAKMTQKELAEKCGMADSAIRKYESGKITPKIGTLRKIAAALGVSSFDLMPEELLDANKVDNYIKEHDLQPDELPNYTKLASEVISQLGETLNGAKEAALLHHFRTLNDNGQTVAVERVQELAQIPAYQRTAEPAQDVPGGADDKEPEQK